MILDFRGDEEAEAKCHHFWPLQERGENVQKPSVGNVSD